MSKLILTRGIPASGKSTFAKAWVAEDPTNRARINRDDLRFQMFGSYWGEGVDENAVTIAQQSLLRGFLKAGRDVVLDNTNLKSRDVRDTLKIAAAFGATVEYRDFPIDLDEAINRDWSRKVRGDRSVGEDVIRNFYKRFIDKNGQLPKPPAVPEPHDFAPYVPGPHPVYSWDIDGTLAHMQGRSPFDPTLYHTDKPDYDVRRLLHNTQKLGFGTIIMSGRSEDHRAETEAWLQANRIEWDHLFMRPSGDDRNDAIIKSEMVDKYVSGVFDIQMHFDDRNRVVDALRAKGIKVAQVNPGDF